MPAFTDYLDLRFAVSDHVGNRNISDVMPRLVQMAEITLNQKLRTQEQITSGTLSFVDGECSLPADFLEMIHLYNHCGRPMRASMLSAYRRPGTSFSEYEIGNGMVKVRGFTGDLACEYYAKIPTLAASASASNWLLEKYGDVYLYAVGLEAAKFLKDVELAAATDSLLAASILAVRVDDERSRWANASVRVQGLAP